MFPEHKGSLSLTHNEHRVCYDTIEQYVAGIESYGGGIGWISDEQRAKAIATDSLWVIQWYPNTPIGFVRLAAADLGVLLAEANKPGHKP